MTFLDAVQAPVRKALVLSGRSGRMEYWSFNLVVLLVLVGFAVVIGTTGPIIGTLYLMLYVALAVPLFTVSVRRLHDHDRSGWWLLVGLIPLVGSFVVLFFMLQASSPGSNGYGANPDGNRSVAEIAAGLAALNDQDQTVPPPRP